jgi:N-dimethylarginine dimethylaminohydrolase
MVAPLREVLVQRPGSGFGRGHEDPALGFLHAVDLDLAARQHEALCACLEDLGATVHQLGADDRDDPDLVYVFDPVVVSNAGAIPLRPGKPNRKGEERILEGWTTGWGIPTAGVIEEPGTVEGGDTFWLRPDLLCVGRSLRTNDAGARQLAGIAGGDVRVFDLPYHRGPAELVHLLSVISPVAEDLAAVFLPLVPVGLHELLRELGIDLVEVPEEEYPTLGCNVLAVRPGVLIAHEANPVTRRALEARGCEVHTLDLSEIGMNGGGGPTCLTRPILRA